MGAVGNALAFLYLKIRQPVLGQTQRELPLHPRGKKLYNEIITVRVRLPFHRGMIGIESIA
jgi:hypothetical protein